VIGVAGDAVALLAAQQLEHRHPERLALDIEQRCIDRPERRAEHGAGAPVGIAVERFDQPVGLERVLSDEHPLELFKGRRNSQRLPLERRLADAVDAIVRVDFHENEIGAADIGDEALEPGDFHGSLPIHM